MISLDGINDVTALVTEHEPGTILNQGDVARRSAVGWRGFRANLFGLLRYSALVRALVVAPGPAPPTDVQERECGALALQYAQQVQAAVGLGRTFGFRSFYFWQPHKHRSVRAPHPRREHADRRGVRRCDRARGRIARAVPPRGAAGRAGALSGIGAEDYQMRGSALSS